jgi:hypothetical protein
MFKPITAIRESILNAKDNESLKLATEIATVMANQLEEIPERTKRRWKLAEKRALRRLQKEGESTKDEDEYEKGGGRRWKLAEKRALERLQKEGESGAAKAKKVSQKPNMKQRRGK